MNILHAALAFFVAIFVLVFVHELGHYLAARLCNVKVERFSLGIGKVIYSRRFGKDQTEWALSLLPVGGYVKMLDAREDDLDGLPEEMLKREFHAQSPLRRMAIVFAGPFANFLLGILILTLVNVHGSQTPIAKLRLVPTDSIAWQVGLRGGETVTAVNGVAVRSWSEFRGELAVAIVSKEAIDVEYQSVHVADKDLISMITFPESVVQTLVLNRQFTHSMGLQLARPVAKLKEIVADSPAMRAGLKTGDVIHSANGEKVIDGIEFIYRVQQSPAKEMVLGVQRGQAMMNVAITPDIFMHQERQIGKIGAGVVVSPETHFVSDSFGQGAVNAVRKTWQTVVMSTRMLARMLIGDASLKNIAGPVTIADYAGQAARISLLTYLSFVAFISISVGVMNLLPIPVLDGGLLLYYSTELLTGRTLSEQTGKVVQRVGIVLLLALTSIAIFNDISRFIL